MADLAERGVDKPVLPGIMPVTSLSSVPRMATMGAAVPGWMVERLQAADQRGGKDAVRHEGVAIAIELCRQLLEDGVPGLHFYTLNRSSATREIYAALGLARLCAGGGEHVPPDVARDDLGLRVGEQGEGCR